MCPHTHINATPARLEAFGMGITVATSDWSDALQRALDASEDMEGLILESMVLMTQHHGRQREAALAVAAADAEEQRLSDELTWTEKLRAAVEAAQEG